MSVLLQDEGQRQADSPEKEQNWMDFMKALVDRMSNMGELLFCPFGGW